MAKKSKTQRAKASARRAARKEEKARAAQAEAEAEQQPAEAPASQTEAPSKKRPFKKADSDGASGDDKKQAKQQEKEKKPKKRRFGFLKDVKAEMKRVTWPSKQEVLRWSGVVIVALIFFGVFAYLVDSLSLLLLTGISSLGV